MRSRLRLLLDAHMGQLQPEILRPELDAVVIEQGAVAESLLLVNQGRGLCDAASTRAARTTTAMPRIGSFSAAATTAAAVAAPPTSTVAAQQP